MSDSARKGPAWSMDGVPTRPGVYLFKDASGKVLYVGKARSLRARLTSYRRPGGDGRLLIAFLDQDAKSVETIVTRTEQEALLLEDTLIKQHKPPHNVRLKDDKSFLMIRLDRGERFPRLKFVRAHNPKEGKAGGRSRFFGPYATASAVRGTLSDLHRVVPLRDCPDSVMNHRSRPCLKHQIGLCSAPCVDLIDQAAYTDLVTRAERILSGDTTELEQDLERRMLDASGELEYERAGAWRDRLAALRRTVEGQGVRPRDKIDRDVLGLARRGDDALVHRLAFREGRLSESRSHHFRSQLPDEELMHVVLTALYGGGRRAVPQELVLPMMPAEEELLGIALGNGVRLFVPSGGDKKRMLDLAGENARDGLVRRVAEASRDEEALEQLVAILDLSPATEVMDCFDISNMQDAHVVASRVRFRRGHPDRAGYRRFKVRGVHGQDDFASMHEVVYRSLKRGVREGDVPDLVVIDGGDKQLARALEARAEAGAWEVAMVGLAKARSERTVKGKRKEASEERVWLPGATAPIELARHSPARLLLERLRDEAHRFAITYHRKERGKIKSRLDSIPGVGPAKRKALLRKLGSVAGVARASVEELLTIDGISPELAKVIEEALRK
ncbi:MAG: excinuclease ABC subunit UvrC [bacterium]|nr:excinuclease ABC subunit UvrC [bacterium]